METMENSMGSADREMDIITDSLQYKLNELSQTWVGLSQDFLNLDIFKNAVDVLNVLAGGIDSFVDSFGGLQTISVAISGVFGGLGHGIVNFDSNGNFTTFLSMFKSSTKDIDNFAAAFKNINVQSENFEGQVISLINQYPHLTKEVKQAALTFDGSEKSIERFDEAMSKSVSTGTKLITTLGNIALNMAAMAAAIVIINVVTTAWDNYVHAAEKARDATLEAIDSVKETETELQSLNDELQTTIDRIRELESKEGLSFVEQDELKELQDYNEELRTRIGLEETLLDIQNQEAREAAQKYFNGEETYQAVIGWGANAGFDVLTGQTVAAPVYQTYTGNRIEVAERQIQEYENLAAVLETVQKAQEDLDEASEDYAERSKQYEDEISFLTERMSELKSEVSDTAESFLDLDYSLDTVNDSDLIDSITSYYEHINDVFGEEETIDLDAQLNLVWNDEGFAEARAEIESLVDTDSLTSEALDDVLGKYEDYSNLVEKLGGDANNLCSALKNLVAEEGEEAKAARDMAQSLAPTALSKAITEVNNLSSDFTKLSNVYASFADESFDLSLIDSSFEDTFSVAGAAYNDFIAVITNGNSTLEEQQDALDTLITAWLESTDAMKYLSAETADVIAEMLEEQGIVNATTFVYTELTKQKIDSAQENGRLISSIADEIKALIDESNIAEDVAQSIAEYYLSKLTANDIMLATDGDIKSIIELCEACKTGVEAIKAFYEAKQGYDSAVKVANSTMANAAINSSVILADIEANGVEGATNRLTQYYTKTLNDAKKSYEDMEEQTDAFLAEIDASLSSLGNLNGVNANTNYRPSTTETTSSSSSSSATESEPTSTIFDWIDYKIDATEKRIDELQDKVSDATGFTLKNATTDTAIDEMNDLLAAYQSMYDMYMEQAYSYNLPESYIDKIINGAMEIEEIIEDADIAEEESIVNQINNFKEWYDKAQDVDDKMKDLKAQIKELNKSKLDNIINDFDNLSDLMSTYTDYRDSLISLREASGETIYQSDYEALIADQNAIYATLATQYNKVRDQYDKLLASGDIEKYTDEWYEYEKELVSIQSAMADCKQEVLELEEQILELRFEPLEEFADYIDYLTDGISTLSSLIGDSNLVVDGMLTDRGLAQVALYEKGLSSAKQTVAEYGEAIDALNQMYEQGDITLEQYNERLYEYQSAQNSAILSVQDYRESILDLCKTAIEQEIDDMETLIQERKDALSAEKELTNYQKKVADAEKNIATLQAKIAALSGSQSREDQALRLQLEAELAEAEEELAEMTADHEQETIEDALDAELDAYTKEKNEELDMLEWNLDAQDAAIEKYLQEVTDNYEIVYATLEEYGEYYSMSMIDVLTEPWDSATSATNTFVDAVSDAVSTINYELNQIDTSSLSELIDLLNNYSNSTAMTYAESATSGSRATNYLDITGQGSWYQGQGGKWWYGEPYQSNGDYWYAENGTYTINGKQYGFNDEGYMITGWDDSAGEWRYFEPENGQLVKSSWRKSGGEWYYLDSNGWMARNAAVAAKDGSGYYLIDSDGVCENYDNPIPFNRVDFDRYKNTYAKGTTNAEAGAALVNEEGYELMRTNEGDLITLKGGEDIFTARETARLHDLAQLPVDDVTPFDRYAAEHLGGDNSTLNINAPLFEVTGGLDVEMRDYIDERIDEVPEIIARYRKIR